MTVTRINEMHVTAWVRRAASTLCIAGAALLAGCATAPQQKVDYSATAPRPETLPPATEGAIFQAGREISLFSDTKAQRVGDMITIILVEKTQASKKASTNSSKDQDVAMDNPTLLGAPLSFGMPGNLPLNGRKLDLETKIKGPRAFKGEGDSSQSNQLQGQITVSVAEVLPNGNLVVRVEKQHTKNQNDEKNHNTNNKHTTNIGPD